VRPLRPPAAELVALDLGERHLRPAVEPGQRPRVRVVLLQLVGGTVDHELAELVERRLALDVAGEARGRRVAQQRGQLGGDVAGRRPRGAERVAHATLEHLLQPSPEGERRRLPLPAVVDLVEAAVVQLVEDVQGEVQVVAGQGVVVDRRRPAEGARRAGQALDHLLAERAARLGKAGHRPGAYPAPREN
jgi:hypothetical protein